MRRSDGFCKKGRLNEDMNLLLDMKNNGTPYNKLIVGLGWLEESGKGRIDEALRLNEEMEKLKLLPDVINGGNGDEMFCG
ncbi:LOW QUALITY PROTEIN: hypothetical protein NC652_020414 [Populus alba x Populus x berolinensis]|nr:LOW QUALITY PROTEIN: hypothetical protein NC652_020414 [Populus alba x Populus x berolinensis]